MFDYNATPSADVTPMMSSEQRQRAEQKRRSRAADAANTGGDVGGITGVAVGQGQGQKQVSPAPANDEEVSGRGLFYYWTVDIAATVTFMSVKFCQTHSLLSYYLKLSRPNMYGQN